MGSDVKLRAKDIEKSFPGVKALDKVNFAVRKGTVHALCGENGAGKSTLMKIINGIYKPDAGEIFIDEKPVKIQNPIVARSLGIAMIAPVTFAKKQNWNILFSLKSDLCIDRNASLW